jgi:hypothetical protein
LAGALIVHKVIVVVVLPCVAVAAALAVQLSRRSERAD